MARLTSENRANLNLENPAGHDLVGDLFADFFIDGAKNLVCRRMQYIRRRVTSDDPVSKSLDQLAVDSDFACHDALVCTAVILSDYDVLRYVDQPPGKVSGVGGPKGRVDQAFALAVSGREVLQNGQTFPVVGQNGLLDHFPGRVDHDAPHAAELGNLLHVSAGARLDHNHDRVLGLLVEGFGHCLCHFGSGVTPQLDDLIVLLLCRKVAHGILLLYPHDFLLGIFKQLGLFGRKLNVVQGYRRSCHCRVLKAQILDSVKHPRRRFHSVIADTLFHNDRKPFPVYDFIHEPRAFRQRLVEKAPADRRPVTHARLDPNRDRLAQLNCFRLIRQDSVARGGEKVLPLVPLVKSIRVVEHRQVKDAQDHVLLRSDRR